MRRAAVAGGVFALVLLAAGAVLGTLRVLVLAPALGAGPALAVELPVMLAVAWIGCGAVLRRLSVAGMTGARLAMAGMALLVLLAGEAALAAVLPGQTPGAWLAGLGRPAAWPGLAAQVAAAALPLVRLRTPAH